MTTLSDHVRNLFHVAGEIANMARLTRAEWLWLEKVRDLYSLVDDVDNSVARPKECLLELCIELECLMPNFQKSDVQSVVSLGVEARSLVTAIGEMVIGPRPDRLETQGKR